jgi:predicted nucleic acid-binding protein
VSIADLDLALWHAQRLLLDSSTLIAFHNERERAHPLAAHLLGRIADNGDPLRGYYSAVSASELLVRPIRTGSREFTFMHSFLTGHPNLTILPVDLLVATQAATLRSATNLRLPDAFIVACGLLAGCEVIVSNDARWRQVQPLFRQFRWLYLSDHL